MIRDCILNIYIKGFQQKCSWEDFIDIIELIIFVLVFGLILYTLYCLRGL
jgi:hypothetical protein